MSWRSKLQVSAQSTKGVTLSGLALLVCMLLALTIWNTPAPQISNQFGETKIDISADRAWTLYPGDCVQLSWQLEGIESLYIEGEGKIGWGEMPFCPAINATSPTIEIRAQNGIYRDLQLTIHHLPDLLFYLLGFIGVCGAGLLTLHYLRRDQLERMPPIYWFLVIGLLLSVVGARLRLAAPSTSVIDQEDGTLAVRFWAEHDSIIFPHECIDVHWSVNDADSIRFNGEVTRLNQNSGSGVFCAGDGNSALLEVVDSSGIRHEYSLNFHSLFPSPQLPPAPVIWSLFLLLVALVIFGLLFWQGIVRNWRKISTVDKVAVVACLLFPIALFLPFGFDSPAHRENWILHSYFEGGTPSFYGAWIVTRFSGLVHRILAYIISSESFLGYNLINSLMHSVMTAVIYGLLRQAEVAPVYAFLAALLFVVYPTNPMQFSLRALHLNYSKLFLLVAMFLALEYTRAPTRLTLAGTWLALSFHVNSFESGLALVLILPLFWWLADRKISWRNFNLTAIWCVTPVFKLAYIVLLTTTGREYYQSGLLKAGSNSATADVAATFLDMLGWVYPYSFWEGWLEAFHSLERNSWRPLTLIVLAAVAGVAWYLTRAPLAPRTPTNRQLLVALALGALLIIPAISVLMWFPLYQYDPWRMLLFVPIGAVIAMLSALLLLTKWLPNRGIRDAAIVGACLLLLLPGISRLFLQLDRFEDSAKKKAQILHDIVTLAPEPYADTHIALITERDIPFLHEEGIYELLTEDVLHSALYAVYQSSAPELAYFCMQINRCSDVSEGDTLFNSANPADLLPRTLVFKLNDDLSVKLIDDPADFLGLDIDAPYDSSQLYDADASLPPRVTTMLGIKP